METNKRPVDDGAGVAPNKKPKEDEKLTLVVQVSEDASVYFYQVPDRLLSEDACERNTKDPMGQYVHYDPEDPCWQTQAERDAGLASVPAVYKPLVGHVKKVPGLSGEQWASVVPGPWHRVVVTYDWC